VAFNWRKIFYPVASDLFAPHTHMKALADSAIVPVPVANTTERAAVFAAAGTVGPTNPVVVVRANAGSGREWEYTVDPTGADWRTFVARETAWVDLTLGNGWTVFPNPAYGTAARYRRTAADETKFKGMIAPGTLTDGTVIATVPAGFRPLEDRYFDCAAVGGVVGIVVGSNGQVRYRTGMGGTPTFVSLDGIQFCAEQ
jgi:hypothetical protein